MTTVPALELVDVRASYGRIEVLHGVNLTVPTGSICALLGPNGAGKSTTLKVASGELVPTRGCVHIAGTHVNGASPDSIARAGVCRIPEGRGIFPNLTVRDNLTMWTYSRKGLNREEVVETAVKRFPRLGERMNQVAGRMSGGEQQMLAMSRALVSDPLILVLDEISMGLAPLVVSELYELVGGLAAEGLTILLAEQFARTALAIADYAAVMTHGEIVMMGEPADVADAVNAAYLGGAA